MKIDFNNIEETVISNMRGGKGHIKAKMFFDGKNKIMRAVISKGCSIGIHTHETSSEIIYALSGKAVCYFEGEQQTLTSGNCHYCPKGSSHGIENFEDEDFVLFAVIPEQ